MSQEISSPLANIIAKMAKQEVRGEATRIKERLKNSSMAVVVLCDVSGSMSSFIGSQHVTKYDALKTALADVQRGYPAIKIIAFSYSIQQISNVNELPAPSGGTNLSAALAQAATFSPRKTIVISDGLPDDQGAALHAADSLTGIIDTIYCGWDGDPGVVFLQKLARHTGGTQATWDGMKELGTVVRGFLPAPASV